MDIVIIISEIWRVATCWTLLLPINIVASKVTSLAVRQVDDIFSLFPVYLFSEIIFVNKILCVFLIC